MSDSKGSERSIRSSPLFTYTEKFYELFPYYLSIGMTAEQYWDGDCTLVRYYRKADELRREKENQQLWLQGMYFYEALGDIAPILRAFAKKGTKPHPYPVAPYPLNEKQKDKEAAEKSEKVAAKGKRYMEAFMQSTNKKFTGDKTPQNS